MSEEISKTADADHCRFCGTTDARFFGSAHTYVRWPADVAQEDGVFHFVICDDCALSTRDNDTVAADQFRHGDRDYLRTCDICGAVGCRSTAVRGWASGKPDGARYDRTYRIQSVLGWTVEIAGFEGGVCSCIECSPIQPVDCVRRPDREYDDDATVLVTPPFEQDGSVSREDLDNEHRKAQIDTWTPP